MEKKEKEVHNTKENIDEQQNLHNQQNVDISNENEQEEGQEQNLQNENQEENMDKQEENLLLEQILNHPIKTIHKNPENDKVEYVIKLVREIIDPDTDIWFSNKKKKPIIKEPGTKKLIKATGATFPKKEILEKQSDFPSRDREQVLVEATVVFPDETDHDEYGVANRANCPDTISQANLPIMARKRAMHRAFYRSDYIGLNEIYDVNETLDVKDEQLEQENKKLKEKLTQLDLKHKNLKNQLCREIITPEGELVWGITDLKKLVELSKGKNKSLVSYIAMLRIQYLNNKEKANS